ncbi:response regulator [Myroides sp. LJL116]
MSDFTILIIDDEQQIQKLLEIGLSQSGAKILQSTTAKEGLMLAANYNPDLILLDLGLPDIKGQEVLKQLRSWYSKAIIILSVENSEQQIVEALDNGATDYLTKPFRMGELQARIRCAIRLNNAQEDNTKLEFQDIEIDLVGRIVKKDQEAVHLTTTEFNLVALLAKNQGRILTHQYILKEVWGIAYQTETQYLRVFIANLRKKLEQNPNKPKHILTQNAVGYRFE